MTKSYISLDGIDETKLKLAFMKDPDGVAAGFKAAALHVEGKIKPYPPPPFGSTYVRTMNLFHRWNVKLKPLGAEITNNTKYGPYVQGGDGQQTMQHAMTGWKDADEVAEEETPTVLKIIANQIKKFVGK